MSRFDAMDDVTVPDQWEEIARRSSQRHDEEPTDRSRHWLLAVAALLIIAVVTVAAVSRWEQPSSVVTNQPPAGRSTTSLVPANDGATTLPCPDGGIVASTIPADAVTGEGSVRRTWPAAGGISVQLLVPGLFYIDFVGERTEQLADPPGMLLLLPEETRFIGQTGFVGPCSSFEIAATGGTEASRRRLLLSTVKGFAFDPTLGVTDCGPLSDTPLKSVVGDNAMAAISTLEPGSLFLSPQGFGGGATDLRVRSDGRCDVVVSTTGGLRPTATVSGDHGTYGLDAVRGFAPNGLDINSNGTVQLDPSASVLVSGTAFSVAVDYWCGDCSRAVMTLHYPNDGITATTAIDGPGTFTGELPTTSTPGSYGWITIVWSAGSGDGRGVWTTNISSGDFAAG